jgi:anti-sigma regulatory factor (Ser/Thr protein kinase)
VSELPSVKVPLRVTLGDSYSTIRACNELENAPEGVVLDATKTTRFEPVVAAMLVATAAERRLEGLSTRWAPPMDEESARFASEVQMDHLVEGRATGAHGTLEMRQLTALDPSYTAGVAELLQAGVPGIDEVTAYPVQLCLNELLQNVFEWAGSKMGCIVLTRWFHLTRSVRIAVVDRGVGIPARLRSLQIEGLHRAKDAEVIVAAVTWPKLTSRAGRAGGLGLKTIHETVTQRGGRLTVISLGAKVAWNGSVQTISKTSQFFRGTAIEIDFRPSEPVANPDEYISVF